MGRDRSSLPRDRSPRMKTVSLGETVSFQFSTIAAFISSMLEKGLPASSEILSWEMCKSEVIQLLCSILFRLLSTHTAPQNSSTGSRPYVFSVDAESLLVIGILSRHPSLSDPDISQSSQVYVRDIMKRRRSLIMKNALDFLK